MIINGGSRSNGAFFASHLMRVDHNERVEVRDMRGLLAENVPDALREMQAVACGTLCKNWFYHADINTREDEHLSPEQWTAAADALERELGLTDQPRFIVEHEKDGRTHQHIIWSRIDLGSMTAISDSHNYRKHETVARALEQAFDHQPTPGTLSREYGSERPERGPKDWESFRALQSKIDPKAIKAELTALWNQADSGRAFAAAVAEQGYILARGDRRDFVIVDRAGDDHSLARQISGVKAAGVRERMADVDRAALPSVAEARELARLHREDASSTGGASAPSAGPELQPEAAREEAPLSDFDALMLETRRQAALLHPFAEPDEREVPPVMPDSAPEAARSAFDEGMAETLRRAARQAAADAAIPEDERRRGSWEAWKANMRHHLGALRGKLLEWWREYFGFEQPDSPQRGYER